MSSGIPYGMTTPRKAIEEMVRKAKREPGRDFYVRRLRKIAKHLAKCTLPRCPVSLLDLPMKSVEFDAVIKEAWAVVQVAPDPIRQQIEDMVAQGRA